MTLLAITAHGLLGGLIAWGVVLVLCLLFLARSRKPFP